MVNEGPGRVGYPARYFPSGAAVGATLSVRREAQVRRIALAE